MCTGSGWYTAARRLNLFDRPDLLANDEELSEPASRILAAPRSQAVAPPTPDQLPRSRPGPR